MTNCQIIEKTYCLTSSSGVGDSRNLMVLISACWNSAPITCTASISKLLSPSEIKFAIICWCNFFWTLRKAWFFHSWKFCGNSCSWSVRAEITFWSCLDTVWKLEIQNSCCRNFKKRVKINYKECCFACRKKNCTSILSRYGINLGTNFSHEYSTHPFIALVMMKQWDDKLSAMSKRFAAFSCNWSLLYLQLSFFKLTFKWFVLNTKNRNFKRLTEFAHFKI